MAQACRAVAARVLATTIEGGQSLSDNLPRALEEVETRERALLQQLCYGSLRSYHRLDAVLKQLLRKPLKAKDADIKALLLLGLYQLYEMRIPPHAAISTTVEATRQLKKPWSTGLVNGILRRVSREQDELSGPLKDFESASHPRWLYRELEKSWPEQLQQIIDANNLQAPMCLRVNRMMGDRDSYLQQLADADMEADACVLARDGIRLRQACDVRDLPGFGDGLASVQDEAAQLAADLLDPQPGDRVLDACAAPGGKTCHLLERQPGISEMVAMDLDAGRLQRVQENLERLKLPASLREGDAATPPEDLEPGSFDRILVDAPCSGTGVIRRHPDIKLLRRASDIDGFAATQLSILQGLWPLLRPGGYLLYATCSILPAENEALLARFLASEASAGEVPTPATWGESRSLGRQLLPDPQGPDGLYYALLQKAG